MRAFTVLVFATSVFGRLVVPNGPEAELTVASVEIANATSTIKTAASLAPVNGRDQAAAAILLEIEQHTEDLACEVHELWANVSVRRAQAQFRSVKEMRAQISEAKSHSPASATGPTRSGSILSVKTSWNRGNLTTADVYAEALEKPKLNKGKAVPGLQKSDAIVLQALQHVQSASRAASTAKDNEDIVSAALLVMDRSRELYNAVELATARVAGGKDAQGRAEEKLEHIMQKVAKQSSALGHDPLAMTRELRLIKHAIREAVGGSSKGDVKRAAREALRGS